MRKLILAGTAAFALAGFAFSGAVQAQSCSWTGYAWSCPQNSYYSSGYRAPYSYPNDAYHPEGYKPSWLPSYPGPRPSSGAGR